MSGAGTKFVSEYGDAFSFAYVAKDATENKYARIQTNSVLNLSFDDVDRLIETLYRIQKELE